MRMALRPWQAGRFCAILKNPEELTAVHPPVLKHSLATHLIAGNVNLVVVKQALGPKSLGSTMVYVSVSDRQAGDACRAAMMRLY
jgi:site-specific recombinase XerD